MLSPFDAYKIYVALKQHFTSVNYDYLKYNGKTRSSFSAFEKRKDKLFFEKLSRHKDPEGLILSNYVNSDNQKFPWIGDLQEDLYLTWKSKIESLSYNIKKDLTNLTDPITIDLKVIDGQLPGIIKKYYSNTLSLETLCIIIDLSGLEEYYNKKLGDDPLWTSLRLLYTKYNPFLKKYYNKEKISKILLDII